jgi:stage II sporulation protein E
MKAFMEKAVQRSIDPVVGGSLQLSIIKFTGVVNKIKLNGENFFIKKGYLLLFVGFLLGCSLILSKLTPFFPLFIP